MQIKFIGATGTVTGSKYLLTVDNMKLLIDCGLFQGARTLRERNWRGIGYDPKEINAVLLTHAHLDHSGYLPLLIRNGFRGPVFCTGATRDLCAILLPDSGHLMEKDAEFAIRKKYSRHRFPRPLYTQEDAEAALKSFRPLGFGTEKHIGEHIRFRFLPAGHILGAAIISLEVQGRKIVFSGDLGRYNSATMVDPSDIEDADYVIVESTYGDRNHDTVDPEDALCDIIQRTSARGGTVIIPSFAVGRAQSILHHLARLKATNRIADLPVFLDSPMAINASDIFCNHLKEHRLSREECYRACAVAKYVNHPEESKALDASVMPKIIISASGMVTGGRILHHLKHYAPDSRNTLLFVGFQAAGTRGAQIVAGKREVKIHGEMVPIRAEVANLSMLSAHADQSELIHWLQQFRRAPQMIFITHGEEHASAALAQSIRDTLDWPCHVPVQGERWEID